RLGVERGHEIVGVAAERHADPVRLAQRDVVGLVKLFEREQLHHQMMHAGLAGLDQRQRVMARIDVEEISAERLLDVIGKAEAEHARIERHYRLDVLDRQYGMSEALRPGTEARD